MSAAGRCETVWSRVWSWMHSLALAHMYDIPLAESHRENHIFQTSSTDWRWNSRKSNSETHSTEHTLNQCWQWRDDCVYSAILDVNLPPLEHCKDFLAAEQTVILLVCCSTHHSAEMETLELQHAPCIFHLNICCDVVTGSVSTPLDLELLISNFQIKTEYRM